MIRKVHITYTVADLELVTQSPSELRNTTISHWIFINWVFAFFHCKFTLQINYKRSHKKKGRVIIRISAQKKRLIWTGRAVAQTERNVNCFALNSNGKWQWTWWRQWQFLIWHFSRKPLYHRIDKQLRSEDHFRANRLMHPRLKWAPMINGHRIWSDANFTEKIEFQYRRRSNARICYLHWEIFDARLSLSSDTVLISVSHSPKICLTCVI